MGEAEVTAALESLAPGYVPDRDLPAAAARVALIVRARAAGATWAAIGSTSGVAGKVAKRDAKRLARRLNREVARMGAGPDPLPGAEGAMLRKE